MYRGKKEPAVRKIAFTAPLVPAVISGAKDVTFRRVNEDAPNDAVKAVYGGAIMGAWVWVDDEGKPCGQPLYCPYGDSGTFLSVAEPLRVAKFYDQISAEHLPRISTVKPQYEADTVQLLPYPGKLREAREMPVWMSRCTLRVESIGMHRLHDITPEDCIRAGADLKDFENACEYIAKGTAVRGGCAERYAYALLWEKMYGSGSWEENPFVWRVQFTAISKNISDVLAAIPDVAVAE